MDNYECPQCKRTATLKYHVSNTIKQHLYYACGACRNRFAVLRIEGWPDTIIGESPRALPVPKPRNYWQTNQPEGVVAKMGCPQCGVYGTVNLSIKRRDGRWRRHICKAHGRYYTCDNPEGISVHTRMKSLLATEL